MRLRQARKSADKTQQEVATQIGKSIAGYRKIEDGNVRRPGAVMIHAISRSVGVDPHQIDEFREALAEYEVVSGTRIAHRAALAESQVVVPDVKETRQRYRKGEFEGDFYENAALHVEIGDLIGRQQRLIKEQQEMAARLDAIEQQLTAQEKTKSEAK